MNQSTGSSKSSSTFSDIRQISRRAFLYRGGLFLTASGTGILTASQLAAQDQTEPELCFGVMTDIHHADKEHAGTRYYRESIRKVNEGIDQFNNAGCRFLITLGDVVDAAEKVETEIGYLKTIDAELARFKGDRHFAIGNHCVYTLTKEQFIENCAARAPYYSFDAGGFHFLVLDACFRADGVAYGARNYEWTDTDIPDIEKEWIKADLDRTDKPSICFVHQHLDLPVGNHYAIKTSPEVRAILEKSGKVLAVLQGHSHKNDLKEINGIHYCTFAAVIEGSGEENNAYGIVELYPNGNINVKGFKKQESHKLSA